MWLFISSCDAFVNSCSLIWNNTVLKHFACQESLLIFYLIYVKYMLVLDGIKNSQVPKYCGKWHILVKIQVGYRFTVAIIENDGHVPWTISVLCDFFLKKGGTISCIVTRPCQYSTDLEKGGLDVPCKLIFSGPVKDDFKQKVQSLLQRVPKLEQFATLATSYLSKWANSAVCCLALPPFEIDGIGSSSSDESD